MQINEKKVRKEMIFFVKNRRFSQKKTFQCVFIFIGIIETSLQQLLIPNS